MIRYHVRLGALLGALLTAAACGARRRHPAEHRESRPVPLRPRRGGAEGGSGSTRANTSGRSSTTIRRARCGRTPSSAIGDTYLGEGSAESLVLAANEYREFLTFYPRQPAGRLRAVQAGDELFRADAGARPRPDGDPGSAEGVPGLLRPLPGQPADAGGADRSGARRAIA